MQTNNPYGLKYGKYAENDLERFKEAQSWNYKDAVAEITSGKKRTHWMWYVFPQHRALGTSNTAHYYGIADRREAEAYLADPILSERLFEMTRLTLALGSDDATAVFGSPDDKKLCSSMTLFYAVSGNPLFHEVLEKFYGGKPDARTLRLLGVEA